MIRKRFWSHTSILSTLILAALNASSCSPLTSSISKNKSNKTVATDESLSSQGNLILPASTVEPDVLKEDDFTNRWNSIHVENPSQELTFNQVEVFRHNETVSVAVYDSRIQGNLSGMEPRVYVAVDNRLTKDQRKTIERNVRVALAQDDPTSIQVTYQAAPNPNNDPVLDIQNEQARDLMKDNLSRMSFEFRD